MKSNSKAVGVFLIIVACMAMAALAFNGLSPQKVDPTKDSISMVDVCGWPWCAGYDEHYAGSVNKPNSEANRNNGEANWYNAQAKQTEAQTKAGQTAAQMGGAIALAMVCGFLFIVGFFLHKLRVV